MPKNVKGISLGFGPVKRELAELVQLFGTLTAQLQQTMQTLGQAQRVGAQPLPPPPIQSGPAAYQTSGGAPVFAAAARAGWTQQASYKQQFETALTASKSSEDLASMGLDQSMQEIARAGREAALHAGQMAQNRIQDANNVKILPNKEAQDAARILAVTKGMAAKMQEDRLSPAMIAMETRRAGPEAVAAFKSMGSEGVNREIKKYLDMPEPKHTERLEQEAAIRAKRQAARLPTDPSIIAAREQDHKDEERLEKINTSFQVGRTAREGMRQAAITGKEGYRAGLGDIVQAKQLIGAGGGADETGRAVADFAAKLKKSADLVDRDLGTSLEKLSSEFNSLSGKFGSLNTQLQQTNLTEEQRSKLNAELARTGADLVQAEKNRKEALEQSGGGGGEGGAGGGGGFRGKAARGIQVAQAIGTLAMSAAEAGFSLYNVMEHRNIGAERRTVSNEAELAQNAFERKREAADMANITNRLKHNADVTLTPEQLKTSLIGSQGSQRAMDMALRETLRTVGQESAEATQKTILGAGRVGLGVLAIGAGGLAAPETAGLSTLAIAAGGQQVVGGLGDIGRAQDTQRTLMEHGGLAGTTVGRWMGAAEREAEENKREARAGFAVKSIQNFNDIQDNEIKRLAQLKYGLERVEETRQVKLTGAANVGALAVTGTEGMDAAIKEQVALNQAAREGKTPVTANLMNELDVNRDLQFSQANQLGLTSAEFGERRNIATGFVGAQGQRATAGQAGRLMGLAKSGFGAYEQIMGNLQGLNQTAGGANNVNNLESVLTSAVTAGFDKSRTIQQFVSTAISLAQASDTANIAMMSGRLAGGAAMMGATFGVADERSRDLAARGIQQLDKFTGATGGYVGAMKLSALVGAGATMTNGLGIMQQMNYSQTAGAIENLTGATSLDKIKDPKVRAMVSAYGDFNKGKAAVLGQLTAETKAERGASIAALTMFGRPIQEEIDRVSHMKPGAARDAAMRTVIDAAAVQGSGTMGFEAGATMAIDAFEQAGVIDTKNKAKYNKLYSENFSAASDTAKKVKAQFDDKQLQDAAANNVQNQVTPEQRRAFFEKNEGKNFLRVGGGTPEETVTTEQYRDFERFQGNQKWMTGKEGKRIKHILDTATAGQYQLSGSTPDLPDAAAALKGTGGLSAETSAALGKAITDGMADGRLGKILDKLSASIDNMPRGAAAPAPAATTKPSIKNGSKGVHDTGPFETLMPGQ